MAEKKDIHKRTSPHGWKQTHGYWWRRCKTNVKDAILKWQKEEKDNY